MFIFTLTVLYLHKQMDKSSKILKKSKIPVKNRGTSNKTKDVPDNTKNSIPQRVIPQMSCLKSIVTNTNAVTFEADEKALQSILSHKGIEPRINDISRPVSESIASSITPANVGRISMWENKTHQKHQSYTPMSLSSVGKDPSCCDAAPSTPKITLDLFNKKPSDATSMMESYKEHLENVKKFQEKMKHLREANMFVIDPEAKRSILNGQGITQYPESSARPSIYKNYSTNSSMMESYLEHEENVRIFRQTTQGLFTSCTTPYKSSHEVFVTKSPFRTPSVNGITKSPFRTPSVNNITKSPFRTPSVNNTTKSPFRTPLGISNKAQIHSALKNRDTENMLDNQKSGTKSVTWSAKKVIYCGVTDYKPISILKSSQTERDETDNAQLATTPSNQCHKSSCGNVESNRFNPAITETASSLTHTPWTNTSQVQKCAYSNGPLTESNFFTPSCLNLKNITVGLPMRIPVTPKEVDKPSRIQSTPVKNGNINLPCRTPLTPKENLTNNLPKRTPTLKSGNRVLCLQEPKQTLQS
ncbi:hypothetical protein BgiMline_003153 [Biomphalaria glabrata]|nr:hypothetical protein BgiMline_011725 [Biomphalaria glabrata]